MTENEEEKGFCDKCMDPSLTYPDPCDLWDKLNLGRWDKSRTLRECNLICKGGTLKLPQQVIVNIHNVNFLKSQYEYAPDVA